MLFPYFKRAFLSINLVSKIHAVFNLQLIASKSTWSSLLWVSVFVQQEEAMEYMMYKGSSVLMFYECYLVFSFKCCFFILSNRVHTLCCRSWAPELLPWPPPPPALLGALYYYGPWITSFQPENPWHSLPCKNPPPFVGPEGQVTWLPFTCLEIAKSKDFSAFLSLHLFQILQIPLCSHARNFSRWSPKREICCAVQSPFYIPHLPILKVILPSCKLKYIFFLLK